MTRKSTCFGSQGLRGDGSESRKIVGRGLTTPRQHHIRTFSMVVFARVDTTDDCQSMHLFGSFGKQFTNVGSRYGSRYRPEWSTRRCPWLWVPAFQLAESPMHVEHHHPLLLFRQFGCGRRLSQNRQSPDCDATGSHCPRGESTEELSPIHQMVH